MTIVSSTHEVVDTQADGSETVIERHTDHLGQVHTFHYRAYPGVDKVATRTWRAGQIEQRLAEEEALRLING